ncbi:YcaO-like family protein [Pantoea sp. At-9b]|uniref:YcaO-like family protein n=1 Tax=Pantoea sp. (strain At-9b) TaxID=592316 RepID=UPI0001F25F29|nr:YcaO-like family protein [Pantoea sp. At-9b]ADU70700.1 protein of unknown function DUF181 [Pantoea sp. At-9b]
MILSGALKTYSENERNIDVKQAIENANGYLHELGFDVSIKTYGSVIKTTQCEIINEAGRYSNGLGKGIGDQAIASGMYEAIEHLHSIFSIPPNDLSVEKLDLDGADNRLQLSTPDFKRIFGSNDVFFSRKKYNSFNSSEDPLSFPYFLTNPYFNPSDSKEINALNKFSAKRYSTNSGTACGASLDEAILHGLLEIVERDAIGIELIRTIFRKAAAPVRRINLLNLPSQLHSLISVIESETKGRVIIWDITNDLNIPVALASLSVEGEGRYFGSGSSLSFDYAIERALLETVQSFHAHTFNGKLKPGLGDLDFSRLPNYTRCLLDKGCFGYLGGEELIEDYEKNKINNSISSMPIKNQINTIIDRLKSADISAYWSVLERGSVFVVHIIAPKLERFHLVARGVPVAPSHRGRSYLSLS